MWRQSDGDWHVTESDYDEDNIAVTREMINVGESN